MSPRYATAARRQPSALEAIAYQSWKLALVPVVRLVHEAP